MQVQIWVWKYKISVPTGSYEKWGETKTTYSPIGLLLVKEDGKISIKFDDMITNYMKALLWPSFNWRANALYSEKTDGQTTSQTDTELPF